MNRASAFCLLIFSAGLAFSCAESESSSTGTGSCGDGKRAVTEICEGTDLGGNSCVTEGFAAGQLKCSAACGLDTSGCCNNVCVNVGDTTCEGNVVMKCAELASGCRTWIKDDDCAATGKTCSATGGGAVCKSSSCQDACTTVSATQCNGTAIESCATGPDGCKAWAKSSDCADQGQSCDDSSGAAQCSGSCVDACKAGELQCSGNVLRECAAQSGGCLGWVTKTDCAASGGVCSTASGTAACDSSCPAKCAKEGLQICSNNAIQTCTKGTNGCLDLVKTQDCGSLLCKLGAGGTAKCEGVCNSPCPTLNAKQCNANVVEECQATTGGCQEWKITTTCPLGQACDATGGTFSCKAATPTGEDCGHVIVVQKGLNTINWTASKNDYLTTAPSCSWADVDGPDVVLVYQPTFTGTVDYTFEKPVDTRWVAVVGSGVCGNLSSQLSCVSEYSDVSMGDSFSVTAGTTYFMYVADTTSGSLPLSKPLKLQITEIDCSSFSAGTVSTIPANGATTSSLKPKLSVTFETAVTTTAGTVTVTGNKGTNSSYNVATASEISFSTDDKTMYIEPVNPFPAGEVVTVSWTGLNDAKCSKPLKAAAWSFTVITPPCAPGTGGMIGKTVTKLPTGTASSYPSVYYVVPDQNPTGNVYFGGSTELWRVPKTGGTGVEVTTAAGLSSSHLGYDMVVSGNDLFTIESKSSGTTGFVWRISKDAGASFGLTDFATFPAAPADTMDSANLYKGRIYMVTTDSVEIWSVDALAASPPTTAKLEASVPSEGSCYGIAVDDKFFYLTCGDDDRLVRVDRTTSAVTLLTNSLDISTTQNYLHAKDTTGDGTADFLYFKAGDDIVYFTCNPAGATPYSDVLASYGTGYGSYGLGLDAAANKLYAWDDSTYELVVIQ
ncbi:MAG: Ig-like domain-containing protein [Myxococcales bacterium]|nr:Ig-like domain-containing protein [Myxococcales bacterium]